MLKAGSISPQDELRRLRQIYERLVAEGQKVLPRPEMPEQVRRQARNLLLRLERRQEEVLLFLRDCSIPFENN